MQMRWLYSVKVAPYILLSPIMFYFLVVWIYPLGMNIYISLHSWHFMLPSTFVGLDNYTDLLGDSDFYKDLFNSLLYALFLPLNLIPAFLVALAINDIRRGKSFFRLIYYATSVISLYALALIFRFLFSEESGLINNVLTSWGITKVGWFSDSFSTIAVIGLLCAYKGVGWNMLVYLAGLQALDKNLFESARIDGASRWKTMIYITVPLMRPVIAFTVVLAFIYLFQLFSPIILIASRGSFTQVSDVRTPSVDAYIYTFALDKAGYGTAIMVVMSVIVLILSGIFLKVIDRA